MDKLTEIFNRLADEVDIYIQAGDNDLRMELKKRIIILLRLFEHELND